MRTNKDELSYRLNFPLLAVAIPPQILYLVVRKDLKLFGVLPLVKDRHNWYLEPIDLWIKHQKIHQFFF